MHITLPASLKAAVLSLGVKENFSSGEELVEAEDFVVNIDKLSTGQLGSLYDLLKTTPGTRTARSHINAYRRSKEDPLGAKVVSIQAAATAFVGYLLKDAIEGWVFRVGDLPEAYLVTGVDYHPRRRRRGEEDSPAYISIQMQYVDKDGSHRQSINIDEHEAKGLTVAEFLGKKGFQKETPELIEQYMEALERFKEYRTQYGKQFRAIAQREYHRRGEYNYEYSRRGDDVKFELLGARCIQNDHPGSGKGVSVTNYRKGDRTYFYLSGELGEQVEATYGEEAERKVFTRNPWLLNLRFFHLEKHVDFVVHANEVEPYVYDPEMRAKLILDEDHAELLDTLTNEMDLVQADIVEGKTGGNVILLAGMPGLGKTLTAEVYAEFRQVPLYKVHSGQLGTTAPAIEKQLTEVYKRATNWGCPVLLDEFDVFGRARGDNLEQNAVVAVFLRTLEYQNNTIFLTTNRADTMDDAILSRCAAIITYEYPKLKELKEIFKVQAEQFLPGVLTEADLGSLMTYFEQHNKKMSGRDVKSILKLAERYARAGKKVDTALLIKCAGFRGI